MRTILLAVCIGVMAEPGCSHKQADRTTQAQAGQGLFPPLPADGSGRTPKPIVTPESGLVGKVVKVDMPGRFVILNFPIGRLPALDQRLYLYRLGLLVGEVKVCGPHRDDNIVGDLVSGEAAVGDQARDRRTDAREK